MSAPQPAPMNGVVRISLGKLGALIGVVLFGIQIATIVLTAVRTNAALTARVDVLATEVVRLVEGNKDLVRSVTILNTNYALSQQRIEVLERESLRRR